MRGPGRSAWWPVLCVPPRVGDRPLTLNKPALWPTPSAESRRLLRRRWRAWTRPRRCFVWAETLLLPGAGALIEPCREAQSCMVFAFSLRAAQAVGNTNIPVAASRTIFYSSLHYLFFCFSGFCLLLIVLSLFPSPPWPLSARGT